MGFEVERFGWTAGDRLELAGRWFDVRGRRFLRPTLEVEVDGGTRRLLASLEHKPWAAEEGEEWLAAFEWDAGAGDIDGAQLTVGPDLAVELSPPATAGGARPDTPRMGPELAAARSELKRVRASLHRERDALRAEVGELRARLAAVEESSRAALREAYSQAALAQVGVAQRQETLELQRDAAIAERDALAAERDTLAREFDETRRGRDKSTARLRSVERELEIAARGRDEAREKRDTWLSRARAAEAELAAVRAQPGRGRPEGPTSPPEGEHTTVTRPMAEPDETRVLSPPARRPLLGGAGPRSRAASAEARWATRAGAILALLLVVAALVLLLT